MRRIGHDLHDGVGQQLTALALFNASLQPELQAEAPQFIQPFKKIGNELHEIIRQIRVLSHGLAPISFEENGLTEALRKLANEQHLFCSQSELRFLRIDNGCNLRSPNGRATVPHWARGGDQRA